MDQNRKFAEMTGFCKDHCPDDSCDICCTDFSDPREVLKVVMEREDWYDFLIWSDGSYEPDERTTCWINVDFITTPGKLRDTWIEWKESQIRRSLDSLGIKNEGRIDPDNPDFIIVDGPVKS
jgi:hypothetical protein